MLIQSSLRERVCEAQLQDSLLQEVCKRILQGKPREFTIEGDGAILFRGRLCVPQKFELKMDILSETHHTRYMEHQGETKMYQYLMQSF